MKLPRVFADFHNADAAGRLRLNCAGTMEDLARQGIWLEEGLQIIVYSEELEAEGEVHFSNDESVWVASIDWHAIHDVESVVRGGAEETPIVARGLPTAYNRSGSDLSASTE
jgi:hypothetical protein